MYGCSAAAKRRISDISLLMQQGHVALCAATLTEHLAGDYEASTRGHGLVFFQDGHVLKCVAFAAAAGQACIASISRVCLVVLEFFTACSSCGLQRHSWFVRPMHHAGSHQGWQLACTPSVAARLPHCQSLLSTAGAAGLGLPPWKACMPMAKSGCSTPYCCADSATDSATVGLVMREAPWL